MDLKGENSYPQLILPLQQGKSVVVGAGTREERENNACCSSQTLRSALYGATIHKVQVTAA
jgi:hypothetical protein